MSNLRLAGAVLVLALAACLPGQALCGDSPSAAIAGRSLFIEEPDDHSGKKVEPDVLGSVHDELQTELGKSQKIASARPDAQVLVRVEIIDYHMRNQANRWLLGAASGKDFITSKVSLVEATTGAVLQSTEVKTSTANQWRGEGSIARLHAREIAKALGVTSEPK